jgi:ubiquitin-protein ligase
MATILEKRYRNILMETNVYSLHQYFNISNAEIRLTDMNTLEMNFTRILNAEIIQFLRTAKIKRLNMDVINIIISYIPNHLYLNLNFHVEYPPMYPFRPPEWSINSVSTNIIIYQEICSSLDKYFKYMVKLHNCQYEHNWTPAVQMTGDIINLYLQFNHFDILTKIYE